MQPTKNLLITDTDKDLGLVMVSILYHVTRPHIGQACNKSAISGYAFDKIWSHDNILNCISANICCESRHS